MILMDIMNFKFWLLKALVAGREGHWAVYFTSPQDFILTFSYSLQF